MTDLHNISLFCITETPRSAEFTKPYEYPLQIGGGSTQITQNHLLGPKVTFPLKSILRAKSTLFRKKATLGPKSAPWRPEGSKHELGLMFHSIKDSQNQLNYSPWHFTKIGETSWNGTFGNQITQFHENMWDLVKIIPLATKITF